MEYIFFTSDLFLWILMLGLIIWVVVLADKVANLDRILKNTLKQIGTENIQVEKQPQQEKVQISAAQQEETHAAEKQEPVFIPAKHPEYAKDKVKDTDPKKTDSMENIFLGNIFNKIGAFALIVAFIIFIKLVSSYIVITDTVKIILGAAAGIGLFLGGLHMHKTEKLKLYSEVLIGTGFATLFITTFSAYYLKVFNTISALSVGVLLLLFVAFISHKMRSVSSLVIGLIGGYLTPHLSGASGDLTYGYLIFLNLISLVYTLNNVKAKWINPVNLLITMFIMFAGCISDDVQKIVYPVVLWAVYIVYDLLRDKASKTDNIACVINYIFLTVMTLTLFKTSVKAVGIMFGVTALVYALLAFFGKKFQNPLYKRYEHYIFLNVWFSILFTLNDLYSILTWSVVAVLLSFAVEKNKLNAVKHYITVYYLSAVVGVLLAKDGSGFMLAEQYTPVLNIRSLIFLVPVLSMILSIVKLKSKESFICNCMRFNIVLLTYFYAVCEITHLLQIMNLEQSTLDYSLYMIYTTIGIVYSVVSHSIYSRTKFLLFNIASVLLWLVSVIMFVVGCFIHPEGLLPIINLRVLAFIAVLYFCSYFTRATRLNFFRYLAVFLGFILCGAESSLLGAKLNINYITTLGWLLYSGAVTLWGILKSKKFLINSGIWIFIFTILRVFIFDLAKVASVYKIFAFLLLGIVLMVVSYIYVRLKSDKN